MLWISLLVFILVLGAVAGGYFLLASPGGGRGDVRKRLSLLELRGLENADIPQVLKNELLSDVPTLNRILSTVDLAVRIDKRLRQADLQMKVGTFVLLSLTLGVVGIVAGMVLHWHIAIGFVVGFVLACVPNAVVGAKRRLRVKKFMTYFPDALEMFARSLRAGHSFTGAIELVAKEMPDPIGPEFQKVFDEQNLGIPLRQALTGMTERVASLDVKFFVTAIMIQRDTGGNLAEIIDKISYVIRERFRIKGQVRIFTAQARMTGSILVLLPIGIALVIGALNPDYLKPLWFDKIGRFMLGMAIVMQIVGAFAIRKIIRIKI